MSHTAEIFWPGNTGIRIFLAQCGTDNSCRTCIANIASFILSISNPPLTPLNSVWFLGSIELLQRRGLPTGLLARPAQNSRHVGSALVPPPRLTGEPMALTQLSTRPEPLTLCAKRCTVVVNDMQNAFCAPGGYLGRIGFDVSRANVIVDCATRIFAAAHKAGIPIFHCQNGFSKDLSHMPPTSPWWHKSPAMRLSPPLPN